MTLDDVQPLQGDSRLDSVKQRRSHNMTDGPYDIDLLGECNRSWMNKDDWRQEISVLYRYVFGNQWGDYVHVHGYGDITEERHRTGCFRKVYLTTGWKFLSRCLA